MPSPASLLTKLNSNNPGKGFDEMHMVPAAQWRSTARTCGDDQFSFALIEQARPGLQVLSECGSLLTHGVRVGEAHLT